MDKMFWFGWLLKGKMEVSLMDTLVFIAEVAFVFGLLVTLAVAVEACRKSWLWVKTKLGITDAR